MKKPFRLIIVIFILSTFFILFFTLLIQINKDSLALKYLEFTKYEKQHFGGILINKTSTPIKIFDDDKIRTVPGNKTSRDIGVFDADSILIEKPLLFENKEYSDGIIKFCDFATITVCKKGGLTIVKPSLSYILCKNAEAVGWLPYIKPYIKKVSN